MLIKQVRYLNLEKLFKVANYVNTHTKDTFMAFGSGYVDMLKDIVFEFRVEKLNRLEWFYLKQFASDVRILTERINLEGNFPGIKQLTHWIDDISKLEFSESSKLHYLEYWMPVGAFSDLTVVARFSGRELANLIGNDLVSFFITHSNQECLVTPGDTSTFKLEWLQQVLEVGEDDNETFTNRLIKTFVNGVYKFIFNQISSNDLLADQINEDFIFSHLSPNIRYLMSISNRWSKVNLMTDPIENLSQKLKITDTIFLETKAMQRAVKEDTTFELGCCMEFGEFLLLYELLPKSCFGVMEPINNLLTRELSTIPVLPSEVKIDHDKEFREINYKLDTVVISTYKDTSATLTRLMLQIKNFHWYKFTLLLTIKQMEEYFAPFIDSYEKSTDYMKFDLAKRLRSFVQTIYPFYQAFLQSQ